MCFLFVCFLELEVTRKCLALKEEIQSEGTAMATDRAPLMKEVPREMRVLGT